MDKKVGTVNHFYTDINVALVALEDTLKIGDKIHFKGHTTDFEQEVESMEIEHEKVEVGEEGQKIGLKVKERVREGDHVYKV